MFMYEKSQRGSATVEAAILVPIIIISVTAVIYIGLILCERCTMQSAVDNASEGGSAGWKYAGSDISTGKIHVADLGGDGLYWRIADGRKVLKTDKADAAAYNYRYLHEVKTPEEKASSAEIRDYVVYKELSVKLEQVYRVPVSGLFNMFGAGDRQTAKAQSISIVNDPAELIRNTDFVLDLEKDIEERYPAVKDIGDKTRNTIQQIKEKVNSFTSINAGTN